MPATFHFYQRENRPDKQGLCPIYLRITHNRKLKYVSTGIKVLPKEWNPNKQEVRRNHRTYSKLNEELQTIKDDARSALRELRKQKKISADSIKKLLEYSSKDNFFELAEEYQNEIRPKSYYTWKQNKVAIEKMKKFHGSDHLPLNYIDTAFLSSFVNFMQQKPYKNKASTIHKNFGAIRAILDKAVLHKLLPENPMNDISFKLPKTNGSKSKTKLNSKQIQEIENLNLERGSTECNARNAFIISYYFCGIRFGDLATLQRKNVKNNRLSYSMSKTGNKIDVKMPDGVKKYLDMYKFESEYDYVMPFLSDLTDEQRENPEYVRKRISSWNALINGQNSDDKVTGLKKVAELAGIAEDLSMHVARHSFSQYAIDEKNVPVYRLMVLLGHQNIKTTMQYLKTINVKAADETIDAIF